MFLQVHNVQKNLEVYVQNSLFWRLLTLASLFHKPVFHYFSVRVLILAKQMFNIKNVTLFFFELACSFCFNTWSEFHVYFEGSILFIC